MNNSVTHQEEFENTNSEGYSYVGVGVNSYVGITSNQISGHKIFITDCVWLGPFHN